MQTPSRPRRRIRGAGATLVLTLSLVTALGLVGLRVERRLSPTSLAVPGTDSARGEALAGEHFGDSSPFTILLRGPRVAVDRQGPRLATALRRDPAATALSPWDAGGVTALRPGPRRALILVDFHVPLAEAMRDTVPALEQTLRRGVRPPLRATQVGFASISRALQEESLQATERAELLAAPLVVLVLLLVFRSVVAAAIPLALGALTVFAGRGLLVLLTHVMEIDALSLVVCTMMGLALGVDYSLFIVSRFREELGAGHPPDEAAARTRASAGRTTAFAGSTLFVSIFVSAFLQPGSLLVSLATALVVVTAISVAIASLALPALLGVLGERINAGRIDRRRELRQRSRVAVAAGAVLRRPAVAAALIAVPLALLAVPALAFNTGAPGVDELGASNGTRRSVEAIDRAVGPGWEAPFVLVAAARHGPIATPARLALLARWQRRIAAQPGVRAVLGPAPVSRRPPRPRRAPGRRAPADEAVSLDRGGQAARVLVISTFPFNTAGSRETGALLQSTLEQIGREGGLRTGLSGGAAILNDYGTATKARLPLVIGAIVLITFLMLVTILRAPLLAALTVGLNLASVAAAIGVVSLVCKVPAGYPLGGHPYIDTVGAAAIFGVTFGLSIDYAVFLIARMKERHERDGDHRAAIAFGLERTAGVITGAAAIMAAVFVSFAAAPIATVSQMGIGLTVAILLDATVVRIILLPALMLMLGDRAWHVPAWLDRLLPHLSLHGPAAPEAGLDEARDTMSRSSGPPRGNNP